MLRFNTPKTRQLSIADLAVRTSQALSSWSLGYLCPYFQRRFKKMIQGSPAILDQHRKRPGLIIQINYYLIIILTVKKSVFLCETQQL